MIHALDSATAFAVIENQKIQSKCPIPFRGAPTRIGDHARWSNHDT
jgi:hypothetical protein